jgi:hypothetical protein
LRRAAAISRRDRSASKSPQSRPFTMSTLFLFPFSFRFVFWFKFWLMFWFEFMVVFRLS